VINNLNDFAKTADYSFMESLVPDPEANPMGMDRSPRQVRSGHYVPVQPEPMANPNYVIHSKNFFEELSLSDDLAKDEDFKRLFTGDLSQLPDAMRSLGWSCGYALSIYGTEYVSQCPFRNGNGYGDGRAISVFEGVFNGKRWEMQLKGGGRSPYCRGADGRAVLRSSVREFLAQEHMHTLGVPSSRSLCLFTSTSQSVHRPWFHQGSHSKDPEVMIEEAIAISTRVAPSFIRVGQLELFGRRARKEEHPNALQELKAIVEHLIQREYPDIHGSSLPLPQKILGLAKTFQTRLCSLVSNWIRVGYCQGNFNSDNCAAGGFTLDYGPFGFMESFDPQYQPWTGGGLHFSFLNQPQAAEENFKMFCLSLKPLLDDEPEALLELDKILGEFPQLMGEQLMAMWASKLGLQKFRPEQIHEFIYQRLFPLMIQTSVDYSMFFRELSRVPEDVCGLFSSFYGPAPQNQELLEQWTSWHGEWLALIRSSNPADINASSEESTQNLSSMMNSVNPKYVLREWLLVQAYQEANGGNYGPIEELNEVMTKPYSEQSKEIEAKFYQKKPRELFDVAGVSHVSCSS
jgi:uncharacterized protein YdiU (UPF0061 family)